MSYEEEAEPNPCAWAAALTFDDNEMFSSVDLFISRLEVLRRIEVHLISFMTSGKLEFTAHAMGRHNEEVGAGGTARIGKKLAKVGRSAKKKAQICTVLAFVYKLVHENRHATQRDVFYCLIQHFTTQQELNQTIQDCVAILSCGRFSMNIMASTRGFVAGCIQWNDGDGWVDGTQTVTQGHCVPGYYSDNFQLKVTGKYLLVVEKDCFFQQFCEARIWEHLPCTIITGCGFPDVGTRLLASKIAHSTPRPIVLGLVDYNPYGVAILMTYVHGSKAMGLEVFRNTFSINWLGIHATEAALHEGMPLTPQDNTVRDTLLGHTTLPHAWRQEILKMNKKVELQAVYNSFRSAENVAAIKDKVVEGRYI